MKRRVACLALVPVLVLLTGCAGLGHTASEREHRINSIFDHDMHALVDDLDMVMMNDRPSRLTPIHQR